MATVTIAFRKTLVCVQHVLVGVSGPTSHSPDDSLSGSILCDSSVDLSGVHTPALGEVQSSQSGKLPSPGQASLH